MTTEMNTTDTTSIETTVSNKKATKQATAITKVSKQVSVTPKKNSDTPITPGEYTGMKYQYAKVAPPNGDIDIRDIVKIDFEGRAAPGRLNWQEFVEDIKLFGIDEPLLCVPLENGKSLLYAGRRRFDAATELGFKTVPVVYKVIDTKQLSPGQTVEMFLWDRAIAENVQRQNMNTWDIFTEFQNMIKRGRTQEQIAKSRGYTGGYVSQHMAIGRLDERVQKLIKQNASDRTILSKVRDLVRLVDHPDAQYAIAEDAFHKDNPWTSTQVKDTVETVLLRAQEKLNAKAKKAKEGAKAKTGTTASDDEGEEEVDKFAEAKVEFVGIKNGRAYLSYLNLRFNKAKMMPDSNAEERAIRAEKLAYEKGRVEGATTALGLKDLPASIVKTD